MTKIFTGGLVLLFIIIGLSVGMTGSAVAQSTGFVDVDASDLDGNGTSNDPYMITNVSELQAIEDDLKANYKLANDIDASDTSVWRNGAGFAPIGGFSSNKDPFEGTLDGDNHTIFDLVINQPGTDYIGVFGYVSDSTIRNIHANNVSIAGNEISGIGGFAGGSNNGTITNVSVHGNIDSDASGVGSQAGGIVGDNLGGNIINSSSSVTINHSASSAGGLVGLHRNGGRITNSFATGDVYANSSAGGLVGGNNDGATISKSYATGDVTVNDNLAGGLVGANNAVIRNSYARGSVSGYKTVGGLVGSNVGAGVINASYASGSLNANFLIGGLAGVNREKTIGSYWDINSTGQTTSPGNATGLTTTKMTGSTAQTNMPALDFGGVWETRSSSYPTLTWQSSSTHNSSGSNGASGGQTVTFDTINQSVATNGSTTYDIILTDAPSGVGSYSFTVISDDPATATFTNFTFGGSPSSSTKQLSYSANNATLTATGGLAGIAAGSNVTLGTVTVTGNSTGSTTLGLRINSLFDGNNDQISVGVTNASISVTSGPNTLPGQNQAPTDPDNDGVYEDLNGDGSADLRDLQPFFNLVRPSASPLNNPSYFDINGDGSTGLRDLQPFFNEVRP